MSDDAAWSLDVERLGAEIAEQGARWRSDPSHRQEEARILEALRRQVPVPGTDVDLLVSQAERLLALEAYPPTGEVPVYRAAAKSVVRRVTFGPLHHLASQVGAFGSTLVAAVRELNGRVTALEQRVDRGVELPPLPALGADAAAVCADQLGDVSGPVVQVTAGAGEVVATLAALGIDAYGIEPSAGLVEQARSQGRDVRAGSLAALETLPAASLGGVVLSGVVDVLPLGDVAWALRRAHATLQRGGCVLVASYDRDTFAHAHPVLADLAPGGRLHPDTWVHLLTATGFALNQRVRVEPAGRGSSSTGSGGTGSGVAVNVISARRCG